MQTGKFLGIGAALSAGLLAAHVASASIQLEVFQNGGASFSTVTLGSSGSYRGLSWSGVSETVVNSGGTASLELSFTGLTGAGAYGFLLSDKSFTETGAGLSLTASGAESSNNPGSSDSFSTIGFADGANNLYGIPTGDTSSYPTGSAFGSASATSTGTAAAFGPFVSATSAVTSPVTVNLASNYSLTTNASITLGGTGASYDASFTTTVAGAAPSAVTLPGSGPLTIVGGLVVVGGLAVRRRFKV